MGKRRLEDFDPNRSDSEDLDYGDAPSPRARPQARPRKNKGSPRKPNKRRRQTYGDSDDDIELDSLNESSEEEASFGESDEEPVTINPKTGRGVRSTAKKPVKYDEESDEEEELEDSDSDNAQRRGKSIAKVRQRDKAVLSTESLIVRLPISVSEEAGIMKPRPRRGVKRESSSEPQSAGKRRSSRISHDEQQPLVALTDSGRHEVVTRAGTATPEPQSAQRATRGGKSLKKLPSAIFEVSHEDLESDQPGATQEEFIAQIQEEALGDDEDGGANLAQEPAEAEDIQMEYVDEDDPEHIVQESQPEDNDDDEGPIARGGRSLRNRRKASSPPQSQQAAEPSRRSLRARKPDVEPSSDFEPDAEGEDEADEGVSDSDDLLKPPRGRSSNEGSQGGRRSGRRLGKTRSQRSRSQRDMSDDDAEEELDVEEIADEAAELDEDNRRNRRPTRKRGSARSEIAFDEPKLRARGAKPDYRILRPELLLPIEEDDGPAMAVTTPQRGGRRGGASQPYRSLFSTFGPFGGAGGPTPVFGGPEGTGATGGVDSDSSDDEMAQRGMQAGGVGGTVGMTPTSAYPKPYVPQALNADPIQGSGGGPPGLGKVKDRKALADADPLGVDPNVTFDGVGGLDNHINQLKEMVTLPLLYPEVFQRFHVTPPRGVLFHGPPGTGKTLLARALASSVSSHGRKVTFYMRKGADALSKWVGEAEKQLRLLFEEARRTQPSIIFFDEIDGLAPVRSSKQEQIHASIVSTLLALMDGMDGRGQVIVIGATNRPDSVDPALRRPGRFDREFYFPLPDQAGRRKIIDIHTRGWDPPLLPEFKDQLAGLTRGYGGADLRALCTEAALNAVQGTFPQIYSSNQKLIIDPQQIKVLAKDFMISVNKIVPSSERSAASGASPLKKEIEPLLRRAFADITQLVGNAIPRKKKITALEEAMYDNRDDELGFQKETMQRDFERSRVFRPRLLVSGHEGMGQQYLGAALLNKLDGLHVQNFDLATLLKDSTRSAEAAIVQLFEEVKRHKPSVIYIPDINTWYESLSDTVVKTFVGLLRSLKPTDPIMLLGVMDEDPSTEKVSETTKHMIDALFSYSRTNVYILPRIEADERREYFKAIIDLVRKAPTELPERDNRRKRKLPKLPIAPVIEAPKGPSKADLKAQKRRDRITLNMLKMQIQQVMDQIKLKYKKFRTPPVDEGLIRYLFDEQDPEIVTTDLTEEQREQQHLFRPYELDKDEKGVMGLREVATNKFYYNLEIVTIEKRLSNGYYKRPKDFLKDIKRLAKDAAVLGDQDRMLKANEMLTNVEVDVWMIEQNQASFVAECQAVYDREQERERERLRQAREARLAGERVPQITPNVPPPTASKTTTDDSGPIVLGHELPGRQPVPPFTPSRTFAPGSVSDLWSNTNGSHPSHQTNGSSVPSRPREDSEMQDVYDSGHRAHTNPPPLFSEAQSASQLQYSQAQTATQPGFSQRTAHTQAISGSQIEHYNNSSSTTTSGAKSNQAMHGSNFRPGDHADFSNLGPSTHNGQSTTGGNGSGSGGSDSHYPDTQDPSVHSQLSQPSNRSGADANSRAPSRLSQNPSATAQQTTQHPNVPSIEHMLNTPESPRVRHRRTTTGDSDVMDITNITTATEDVAGAGNDDEDEQDDNSPPKELVVDLPALDKIHAELVDKTSGLTVEQLEQVTATLMNVIWDMRGNWNRIVVGVEVQKAFNAAVMDIEACQRTFDPSQN